MDVNMGFISVKRVKPGFGLPIEVRVTTGRLTLHLPGVGQDQADEAEEADDDHGGLLNGCFGSG